MVFETFLSESDKLEAALNASYGGLGTGGKLKLSAEDSTLIVNSSIQVLVLGGGAKPAINLIRGNKIENINTFLEAGANFISSNPGSPISYTVSYLKDNDIAAVKSTTDYDVSTMKGLPSPVRSAYIHFTSGDDGKSKRTGLNVILYDQEDSAVANGGLYDNNDQGVEYDDDGSNELSLTITAPKTNSSKLQHGKFVVSIRPHGNDTWKLKSMELVLKFKDGTELHKPFGGDKLYENDTSHTYNF